MAEFAPSRATRAEKEERSIESHNAHTQTHETHTHTHTRTHTHTHTQDRVQMISCAFTQRTNLRLSVDLGRRSIALLGSVIDESNRAGRSDSVGFVWKADGDGDGEIRERKREGVSVRCECERVRVYVW